MPRNPPLAVILTLSIVWSADTGWLSVFIRHTGGTTFQELHRNGGVYCARYRRPDGGDLLLVWTERGVSRLALSGHVDFACDMMGAKLPIAPLPEATENPIYLGGKNLAVQE